MDRTCGRSSISQKRPCLLVLVLVDVVLKKQLVHAVCTGTSRALRDGDCVAWQRFYDTAGGLAWDSCSRHRADPCACSSSEANVGITCDTGTKIVRLDLQSCNVLGTLDELSGMSSLKYLMLRGNTISGTIPSALGSMTQLRHIDLDNNQLRGTLPDLRTLTQLTTLQLHSNNLGGSLPDWLDYLTALRQLVVSNNQFVGTIPKLARLHHLKVFFAGKNRLDGTVPSTLGSLPALRAIDFYDNRLTSAGDVELHRFTQWCDLSLNPLACPVLPAARKLCMAASRPCAPRVLAPPAAGDRNVTVFFEPPMDTGGKRITHYTVRAHPGSTTAMGEDSPISVGPLKNGHQYTFTVTATNARGESEPSEPTLPATPRASVLRQVFLVVSGISLIAQVLLCTSPNARTRLQALYLRALVKKKRAGDMKPTLLPLSEIDDVDVEMGHGRKRTIGTPGNRRPSRV